MLSNEQSKSIELTLKLNIKVKEFKKLCNRLEEYKKMIIIKDLDEYKILADEFKKNSYEINQLKSEIEKNLIKNKKEISYSQELFGTNEKVKQETNAITVVPEKENIFVKIFRKIKQFFKF